MRLQFRRDQASWCHVETWSSLSCSRLRLFCGVDLSGCGSDSAARCLLRRSNSTMGRDALIRPTNEWRIESNPDVDYCDHVSRFIAWKSDKGGRVKSSIHVRFVWVLSLLAAAPIAACFLGTEPENLGSCSVDCSNYFQGMDITHFTFITREACIQEGEDASCTATYCPPEGEGECAEVYDP